jgi:hypothetical protein
MSLRGVDQTVHDFGLNKMLKMFATCPCILVFSLSFLLLELFFLLFTFDEKHQDLIRIKKSSGDLALASAV